MSLQPFKQDYDNRRDDHVLFRHLTRSAGLTRQQGDIIQVLLLPQAAFAPKVADIIDRMLDQLNANRITMPDGSGSVIHFRMLRDQQIPFGLM